MTHLTGKGAIFGREDDGRPLTRAPIPLGHRQGPEAAPEGKDGLFSRALEEWLHGMPKLGEGEIHITQGHLRAVFARVQGRLEEGDLLLGGN